MHASLKDRCYFPIQTDTTGLMITTERLNPFKRWAQLLLRAGNNDIGHGRIDDALEKYLTVHKMSKHMYQQNFLIEQLVALSIEALSHSQMIRFAATGEANDEHLNLLEEALRNFEYDWPAVWPMVMDSEKMFLKSFLGHFYEINSKGQTRLNRKPLAVIRRYNKYVSAPGYWQRKAAKSKAIFRWFVMPSLQRTLKLTDESYERYYKMAEPDYDWEKSPEDYKFKIRFDFMALLKTMTSTMEGAFRKIHHLYLRTENQRNGAQIIIALRRYKNKNGRWPENLDQLSDSVPSELLIDPVNGDSFVYKFTLDNFTLYSKGENNIDEDGDKWTEKDKGTKTDDLLIWPPKEKRSKKNRNKDGRS